MPEGPEVKRFGEELANAITRRHLTNIEVLSGRYTKSQLPGLSETLNQLPIEITGVGVHGKFLYWLTSEGNVMFNSLGMTGHWGSQPSKHDRVVFTFDDNFKVYFSDIRNFGTIKLNQKRQELIKKLRELGPDILTGPISDVTFEQQLRKYPDKEITEVLMDQHVIAGVGNYIKSESLWHANISPLRKIRSLSHTEMLSLNKSIHRVASESYKLGGASLKDYKQFDGSPGQYNYSLAVYNKKKDPNGLDVVKTQTLDGRTTFWVPQTQL